VKVSIFLSSLILRLIINIIYILIFIIFFVQLNSFKFLSLLLSCLCFRACCSLILIPVILDITLTITTRSNIYIFSSILAINLLLLWEWWIYLLNIKILLQLNSINFILIIYWIIRHNILIIILLYLICFILLTRLTLVYNLPRLLIFILFLFYVNCIILIIWWYNILHIFYFSCLVINLSNILILLIDCIIPLNVSFIWNETH
jgi:hypothetical protein